jgi:hypothetical protein
VGREGKIENVRLGGEEVVEVGLEIGVDEHVAGDEQVATFVAGLDETAAQHQLDISTAVAMTGHNGSAISMTAEDDVSEGHCRFDGSWKKELVSTAA